MRREHPEDERHGVQLRRAGLPGIRDLEVPDRHPASRTASPSRKASPAFRRRGRRRWGSGKPVIALGSDIDDIPQASQKPGVAWHEPIIEGAPGHGEGHNSGHAAADHGGARGEEDHGAAASAGHAEALARRRRRTARHEGLLRARRRSSRTSTSASSRTSARNMQVSWGDSAGNGMVSVRVRLQGRERARRRRAVARPLGARRGRADGHRLELPPRAPPHLSSARTT